MQRIDSAYLRLASGLTRVPFDCEFCDDPPLRAETTSQADRCGAIEEIRQLQQAWGIGWIFLRWTISSAIRIAKDLLKRLIPVNNSFGTPPLRLPVSVHDQPSHR